MLKFYSRCLIAVALGACAVSQSACNQAAAEAPIGVTAQPISSSELKSLAKQCGLECPDKGIADGNAQISGVVSVDAFFASVVNYHTVGENVASDIDAQLNAIRADFDIAADADLATELNAKFKAYVDGSFKLQAEPVRCEVDAQATITATAHCDAKVDPGSAMLECSGSCDAQAGASASCDASADLECTARAPSVACDGMCQGTCRVKLDAAATCDGICEGKCDSHCSAFHKNSDGDFESAGHCSGKCTGYCRTELSAAASCDGECDGQCTVTNPSGGCTGDAQASCKAKAGAMVKCDGHCDGEVVPPQAKAECQASAQADAKVNVTCTPPRLAASFVLKTFADGSADAKAQVKFALAAHNLEKRMPALLASLRRAQSVTKAGTELVTAAHTAVHDSVKLAADGDLSVKSAIGLGCALTQLDDVDAATKDTNDHLNASIDASTQLTSACGLSS